TGRRRYVHKFQTQRGVQIRWNAPRAEADSGDSLRPRRNRGRRQRKRRVNLTRGIVIHLVERRVDGLGPVQGWFLEIRGVVAQDEIHDTNAARADQSQVETDLLA